MSSINNPTVAAIIKRLPQKPMLSADDIAAAIGHRTTNGVIRTISMGQLAACYVGGRYVIARTEAVRWLESTAVVADEAE